MLTELSLDFPFAYGIESIWAMALPENKTVLGNARKLGCSV